MYSFHGLPAQSGPRGSRSDHIVLSSRAKLQYPIGTEAGYGRTERWLEPEAAVWRPQDIVHLRPFILLLRTVSRFEGAATDGDVRVESPIRLLSRKRLSMVGRVGQATWLKHCKAECRLRGRATSLTRSIKKVAVLLWWWHRYSRPVCRKDASEKGQ